MKIKDSHPIRIVYVRNVQENKKSRHIFVCSDGKAYFIEGLSEIWGINVPRIRKRIRMFGHTSPLISLNRYMTLAESAWGRASKERFTLHINGINECNVDDSRLFKRGGKVEIPALTKYEKLLFTKDIRTDKQFSFTKRQDGGVRKSISDLKKYNESAMRKGYLSKEMDNVVFR